MPILQKQDQQAVRQRFEAELTGDVNITLYTQRTGLYIPGRECRTCGTTQQLLEEVAALSPKIHLEIVDFYSNQEAARASGIDRIPAFIVSSNGGNNVRFFGVPAGYEFASLLDTIVEASQGQTELQTKTREWLMKLQKDVHIQVFVTPT
jgi:glutaredoxin-like protein